GDAVVDVVAEGLRAVLDPDSAMAGQRRNRMRKKNRDLMLSIRAGEDGVIRRILAPPGTTVAVGETIGIVAADLAVDVSSAEALHNARDFRLVAAPVSPGDGHPEEDA
ncbi:MAG: hypothetical protein R3320_08595, partial [Nitriliruptorales bacterium]|nr:hypothetical protein [Nitriliruptorales bacterium]